MKKLLIKLLLRLLNEQVDSDKVDRDRMDEWLVGLVLPKSGFQDWYTLRKKAIMHGLSLGKEGPEYWKLVGQLLELKQLAKSAEMQFDKQNKIL